MRRTLYYGAALLGILFTGCSSDLDVPEGVVTPLDKDQTVYVNMCIHGDGVSGSRAAAVNGNPELEGDFEAGVGEENAVNNVYFVFYDAAGNVVGDIVPVDLSTFKQDATLVNGVVEQAYSSTIPVTVKKGEYNPSQVICYINPISPPTLQNPLSVIQTISRSDVYTKANDGSKLFGMSNSVYYPNGATEDSMPQIAVEIPAGNLYSSEEAAKEALNSKNTVNIYVERYAARLSFNAEKKPNDYVTASRVYGTDGRIASENEVILSFQPLYWAVNAESKRSYVIKSFRQESTTGTPLPENYTYDALNTIINLNDQGIGSDEGSNLLAENDQWNWNNPNYFRSYWGMSPAYYQTEYPEVSSDLPNIPDIQQKYISFNELVGGMGYDAENTTAQYFKETTVGFRAIHQSKNPVAAVPSVIYVGQYKATVKYNKTDDEGNTSTVTNEVDNPSFYTYLSGSFKQDGQDVTHPYVYFNDAEGSPAVSAVAGGESMLKRFFAQQTILYKAVVNDKNEVTEYVRLDFTNEKDLATLCAALEVSVITEDVRKAYDSSYQDEDGETKFQNNTRTLQFKRGDDGKLTPEAKNAIANVYIMNADGYRKIVDKGETVENNEISLTEANLTLMRQVGYSYYYNLGHAYFNIPVKHLGWYRKGNTQNNPDGNGQIDWTKVRVGDFGMVRNHSYSINVTQITGLAQGIGDDDNPIVPPSHSQDLYMAYSVRILKWALVPQQDVKL